MIKFYKVSICVLCGMLHVYICTYHNIGTSGTTPSLISLLGHSCQQMLGQGEVVKDMTVNDFYTAIVTDCGRVYWW